MYANKMTSQCKVMPTAFICLASLKLVNSIVFGIVCGPFLGSLYLTFFYVWSIWKWPGIVGRSLLPVAPSGHSFLDVGGYLHEWVPLKTDSCRFQAYKIRKSVPPAFGLLVTTLLSKGVVAQPDTLKFAICQC